MMRVVLDTNCFDALSNIDFPKIKVLKLQLFASMLKKN